MNLSFFTPRYILTLVLVVLYGDGPHGNEEDPAHQVDEELQDGQVRAQQVGNQHGRHYDRKPDSRDSLRKKMCYHLLKYYLSNFCNGKR